MDQADVSILITDDDEVNRELLSHRLANFGYRIFTAKDGVEALAQMQQRQFSLVLLDIDMPKLDGFQVLRKMKADDALRDIPVVMVTAKDDLESTVKCIELGADDHIPKPFDPVLLRARVSSCIEKKRFFDEKERYRLALQKENTELEGIVQQKVNELTATQLATIFAMSKLAESKDPETGAHLDRLREYCRALARALMKLPKYSDLIDDKYVDTIYAASPLHDVGKVGIPDSILLKPAKLNEQEWQVMRSHCAIGATTLRAVHDQYPGNAFVQMGIEVAQSHHEKWDGSGYPEGLTGDAIPLSARILALGDCYDALRSKRCYKEAICHEISRDMIQAQSGKHFDPEIVDVFLAIEDVFDDIRKRYLDDEGITSPDLDAYQDGGEL